MDLLFKEYASPFVLLDGVISAGRLNDFLDTFQEQREDRQFWEYYIHKLPPWDERSFEQFKSDIRNGAGIPQKAKEIERPSEEELETTVRYSYEMLQNFEIPQERG